MYHVVDIKTGAVMLKTENRRRARNKANSLDLAYGAIRYVVRIVAA